MRIILAVLIAVLAGAHSAQAQGLLVPTQQEAAPFVLESHQVHVTIEDQAAVTRVEQTFRNPTNRALEATYIFPVPKGASVKKFTMWVDGKEMPGELVEADKARAIYTDIVRRTRDPGLLEYLGNDILKVRVFPVPAHGEQKLAVSFTSLAPADSGLVEYIYPLKADTTAAGQTPRFTLEARLKAQHPIQSVYSPTHAIKVQRTNDREAIVLFEGKQSGHDRDFQLFYAAATKDVGVSLLAHRADRDQNGCFMLLISPRAELAKKQQVPRDMVFVLDTSGSMAGKRIIQARNALKYCLRNLDPRDRFAMIHFATTVTMCKNNLSPAGPNQIDQALSWVDGLEALGSTNIDEALATALNMRSPDASRSFTIVFFTDGQPTIGETDPEQIIKNVVARNTAGTRIFTFGVGDDVNTVLLDQLAEKTRSISTYVRESENIEGKVSGLYAKISQPVLTDLALTVGDAVSWTDVYPPKLPDLFHGNQLVVLGRYRGQGPVALKLTGMVGKVRKQFDYEVNFPAQTGREKAFVEDLWARRKVGYLLDQIRIHGENKETRDEVLGLAKKYGIVTPYTSYVVVPDVPPRVTMTPPPASWVPPLSYPTTGGTGFRAYAIKYPGMMGVAPGMGMMGMPGMGMMAGSGMIGGGLMPGMMGGMPGMMGGSPYGPMMANPTIGMGSPNPKAKQVSPSTVMSPPSSPEKLLATIDVKNASGKEGVDLAQLLSDMRNQERVARAVVRQAAGRNCRNIGGVWTDDGVDAAMPVVKIKAQSAAYFRILARQPQMSEVFQLGNRVVWVTPSRTVLIIEADLGADEMSDADIDRLFSAG